MSSNKIEGDLELLHWYTRKCAENAVAKAKQAGLNVEVFETVRTYARQSYLVSIKNSKTMNSYHRLGLAVDIVFKTAKGNWTWDRPKADWDKLAQIVEECGFSSGWYFKSFKDGPHAQIDFNGISVTSLYKKLDECEQNLDEFYKYVDDILAKDSYHGPRVKAMKEPAKPTDIVLASKPTWAYDDAPAPTPTFEVPAIPETAPTSFWTTLINVIMGIFKK